MRAGLAIAVIAAAALVGGCSDDDDPAAAPTSTAPAITPGPVAAMELVTGDCITGLVIGAQERAEIRSARITSCDTEHELEVFASLQLEGRDFDGTEAGEYPGRERVIDAADDGCEEAFETLDEDEDEIGLIAIWPTATSWAAGDRTVVCAGFSRDGVPFTGRRLVGQA